MASKTSAFATSKEAALLLVVLGPGIDGVLVLTCAPTRPGSWSPPSNSTNAIPLYKTGLN